MTLNITPPVIAHRGASSDAPENTLAAFVKAKAIGAKWVEFDVMLTADHQAVVIHDETLDRTTNGKGRVCDYTLAEIQALDAGSWFSAAFAHEKIPSFKEAIDCLFQLGLSANVEIKAQPGMELDTAKIVMDLIAKNWRKEMTPPLVSSFSVEILQAVRSISSTCQIGFLKHQWLEDWEKICRDLQCVSMDVNFEVLHQESVQLVKSRGLQLLSYTVDDPLVAAKLFGWGVDAVFTNYPGRILAL